MATWVAIAAEFMRSVLPWRSYPSGAMTGISRKLPDTERYGILPKGHVLQSPCGKFFLQLIEPKPGILDVEPEESLQRVGLGTPGTMDQPGNDAGVARPRKLGHQRLGA